MNEYSEIRVFIESVLRKSKIMILRGSFQEFNVELLTSQIRHSKTRVYSYFGGKQNILDILFYEELKAMKDFIVFRLMQKEICIDIDDEINILRLEFVDSNLFMRKYCMERSSFGKQLQRYDLRVQKKGRTILKQIKEDFILNKFK